MTPSEATLDDYFDAWLAKTTNVSIFLTSLDHDSGSHRDAFFVKLKILLRT